MHPLSIGLFCFDSSQNHQSCAPDALNAASLNLKDDGKNVPLMRDEWFYKNQEKIIQPMQFPNQPQIQKEIRTILEE